MSPFRTLRCFGLVCMALGLLLELAPAEAATRRVALVIGNSRYVNAPQLANPGNDARLIAQTLTLQQVGFTLVGGGPLLDLDKARFESAVRKFGEALQGADVALFYYSGHGMQVSGTNWLVPVDAKLTRPQDLEFVMVDAGAVLRQMQGSGTKLNVVILDACRDNPFVPAAGRGVGRGLAQMQAPEGTLISYATQPDAEALDGTGRDSPYTMALANSMRQPGLDLFQMFNRVGLEVKRSTDGQQLPWVSNSPIEGEFYFAGTAATAPLPPAAPAAPKPEQLALAPARVPSVQPTVPLSLSGMPKASKCSVGPYAFTRNSSNSFAPVSMVTSADGWCWSEPTRRDGSGYAAAVKLPPEHGEAVIVVGNSGGSVLSYRPAAGYVGADHFQFIVYPVDVVLDFTVDVQAP